jgi:hypothetical protein
MPGIPALRIPFCNGLRGAEEWPFGSVSYVIPVYLPEPFPDGFINFF